MAVGIKMVLVFALLGGTLWFLRRHDRSALVSARRNERPVALLAQAKVGKTASVALVRIGTEAYAVGVTEQNVALLFDRPVEVAETAAAEAGTAPASQSATARPPVPATLGAALRSVVGRRSRVQYLDVVLPAQPGPPASGTNGSGSSPTARMPEPLRRR